MNSNGDGEGSDDSNSTIDILNKSTYFSNGIKLNSATKVDKLSYYFSPEDSGETFYGNENAEVGGFSIADLIFEAYSNGFLPTETDSQTISYYANLLTTVEKLNASYTWVPYTVVDDDFSYSENNPDQRSYQQLRFTPKDRSIYETVSYGVDSNCADKIYDRWYNIANYTGDIKAKYAGITFECNIDINTLKAGDTLSGTSSDGILEALVVGGTENKVRLIISGVDCCYINGVSVNSIEEWEQYPPDPIENPELYAIYEAVMACEDAQLSERGKSISAELKSGNVLFSGHSNNIIGNISGVENSVFGTLEGYGLTSEGNSYFVNPGIALTTEDDKVYLKLTNKDTSFIGLNKKGENWITIEPNGGCDMRRDKMYNINNHISFCNFGPIVVQEDGSATIGSGDTQITISATGEVSIPSAAIV